MHRRKLLQVVGGGLVTGVAGCSTSETPSPNQDSGGNGGNGGDSGNGGNSGNGGGNGGGSDTDTPSPTPKPVSEPDPLEFSGDTATVTDTFTLQGGFVAIEYSHEGSGNFIATLKNPDGDHFERLPANEIGQVSGAWAEGVEEGSWLLDIDANGSWNVTVRQPRVAEGGGKDLPVSRNGDASDDYFAVNLQGMTRVSGTHDGGGNFQVMSYKRNGGTHLETLVFNEIGQFQGETSIDFQGTSWIYVEGSSDWSVSFKSI